MTLIVPSVATKGTIPPLVTRKPLNAPTPAPKASAASTASPVPYGCRPMASAVAIAIVEPTEMSIPPVIRTSV